MTELHRALSQMDAEAPQEGRDRVASAHHPVAKPRALNERRENFCQAYILLGNGTRAAIRAGYAEHSARQQSCRLLTNAYILERIADLRRDLGIRNRIDRDTVMAKLEAAYRGAMTGHMFLTAVRAAEAQARLAGLMPERNPARRTKGAKNSGPSLQSPESAKHANGTAGTNSISRTKTAAKGNGRAHFLESPDEPR